MITTPATIAPIVTSVDRLGTSFMKIQDSKAANIGEKATMKTTFAVVV